MILLAGVDTMADRRDEEKSRDACLALTSAESCGP